jgi:hypothetical protein
MWWQCVSELILHYYYDDYDYDDDGDDAVHNNNVVTVETMSVLYEVQASLRKHNMSELSERAG